MKDEIIIKIKIERLHNEIGRINNMIKSFVKRLEEVEDLEVVEYSKIKTEFIGGKYGM